MENVWLLTPNEIVLVIHLFKWKHTSSE